jgi:N-acetylglucosaminyl-diphospho-decaprenol L-rhamnosyltransferase
MMLNNKITIIIVAYDSTNLIFECLKNLKNFNIIIVDNKNDKIIINKLKMYKNISIITKNKNLGFGNAVNFAFEYVDTEHFLILNPDIIISEDSILKIKKTIDKYENCAIAAPINIPDDDSFGIFPEKRVLYETNKSKTLNKTDLNFQKPIGETCVDVSKGCALLIKSKYFKKVGGFSKEFFLFWEEVDLCRKFRKEGLSVIINPDSLAEHKQGNSTKKNIFSFLIRSYHNEISPLYYFKVNKFNAKIYKNILKYCFRSISYIFIFNFNGSLKNLAKLYANINYILK